MFFANEKKILNAKESRCNLGTSLVNGCVRFFLFSFANNIFCEG